jgi:hypothetical protein
MHRPFLRAVAVVLVGVLFSSFQSALAQESHGDSVATARRSHVVLPPPVLSHQLPSPATAAPDTGACNGRRAVIGGAIGAGIGLLAGGILMALKLGDPDFGTYSTGDKIRDIAIPTVVLGTLGFFIADATKPSKCE